MYKPYEYIFLNLKTQYTIHVFVVCYDLIIYLGEGENYAIRLVLFFVPAAAVFLKSWEPLKDYNHRKTGDFFFIHTRWTPRTVLIIRRDILFPLQLAALRHCTSHDTHSPRLLYILYPPQLPKLLRHVAQRAGTTRRCRPPLIAAMPGWSFMNEACTIFYLWTVHVALGYYNDT